MTVARQESIPIRDDAPIYDRLGPNLIAYRRIRDRVLPPQRRERRGRRTYPQLYEMRRGDSWSFELPKGRKPEWFGAFVYQARQHAKKTEGVEKRFTTESYKDHDGTYYVRVWRLQ